MVMLLARAAAPAWVVILGLGVFFAPAGMTTTVVLVALAFICTGAVITAGVRRRTLYQPTLFKQGAALWNRTEAAYRATRVVEPLPPKKLH